MLQIKLIQEQRNSVFEDKLNEFLENHPGVVVSVQYSTALSGNVLINSALITYKI